MFKIIIALIGLLSLSCFSSASQTNIDYLLLEFDGSKGEFYEKYNLYLRVTDTSLINRIAAQFNNAEILNSCPSLRPVLWEIDASIIHRDGSESHFFRIGSTTYGKIILSKAYRCFSSDELISAIMKLVNVEEIKNHIGPMDQAVYDQILSKRK